MREIAEETVALDHLKMSLVRGMQKHVEIDEPEETHELDLDTTLFGVADPAGTSIDARDRADRRSEEAVEEELEERSARRRRPRSDELDEAEELAEDMLEVEEEVDLAELPRATPRRFRRGALTADMHRLDRRRRA